METYKKPTIVDNESVNGGIPLVLAGLSAAKLAVVGVAAGLGLGVLSRSKIDSTHTDALTARKNFSFA